MPADWSRPVDVERLADVGERHDFDVDLAEFPRLADQLARSGARARGSLQVAREQRVPVVDVEVHAQLPLICQRCLEVVEVMVEGRARVAVVADLASADALGADFDPFLSTDGRLALRDLAEEQLLLGLPLVARHADDDPQCGSGLAASAAIRAEDAARRDDAVQQDRRGPDGGARSATADADAAAPVTQKPFAELGELLKRKR